MSLVTDKLLSRVWDEMHSKQFKASIVIVSPLTFQGVIKERQPNLHHQTNGRKWFINGVTLISSPQLEENEIIVK